MNIVIVLVWALVTLGGTFLTVVPVMRQKLFPQSVAYRERDPARQAIIVKAEAVARRGAHLVFWPGFVLGLVIVRVAEHTTGTLTVVLILTGGLTIVVVWGMVAVRRWWQWAIQRDVDLALVEQLAIETRLVWPRHTWLGRRQRRTWMQLPPERQKCLAR